MSRTIQISSSDARQALKAKKPSRQYDWRLQYQRGQMLMYGSQDPEEAYLDAEMMTRQWSA